MTVTEELKIIHNKIKANQTQYVLDRLAAKISLYSSGDLRKYEYLTGEDLGYKPSVVEQTKFDYSPLGKVFNKGLTEDKNEGKKEELLNSVKNIGDKTKEQLKKIKNQRTEESGNKDNKAGKTKNSLIYDQNHDFCKYRLNKVSNISSTESKFDKLEMFYRDFISSKSLGDKTKENTDHKFVALNNALNEYDRRKKFMKGSLGMIKFMVGRKNVTLKV